MTLSFFRSQSFLFADTVLNKEVIQRCADISSHGDEERQLHKDEGISRASLERTSLFSGSADVSYV